MRSKILDELQMEFLQLNRKLTYATLILLGLMAVLFWLVEIEVFGKTSTLVGVVFMLLAVFFFQIPHISYNWLVRKYQQVPDKLALLGPNWRHFKKQSMQRN